MDAALSNMWIRGYTPWETRERLVDFHHCYHLCYRECGVHLQKVLLRFKEYAANEARESA